MKFVDEATIKVQAGRGGDGSASFRREKYVPRGGPDGGDGGRGGSVYLLAKSALNTLVDFRHQTQFVARSGEHGSKKECNGKDGEDCVIPVPIGTVVKDLFTDELIGDLVTEGQRLLVAQGGARGIGNVHFKSSTNRAPRQTIPGKPGEARELKLELKLLAQVGMLGLPNAGKSTFIRSVSKARPKVADYPFTTLHPQLGIVALSDQRRFVIADIPGLVPGASIGKGLGIQFLRHLSRTQVLIHLVEIEPADGSDPVDNIRALEHELKSFSEELAAKPRWLVFNKIDNFFEDEAQAKIKTILERLNLVNEPYYAISALAKTNLDALCEAIMAFLQHHASLAPQEDIEDEI